MAVSFNKHERLCDTCRRNPAPEEGALLKCARCKCAMYCGPKCQKAAWPGHKELCKRVKPLEGLEGKELAAKTAAVVSALRTEAIADDDGKAGLVKFLFAHQVETVFGGKRVFEAEGKQFKVSPDISHPKVFVLKSIELNLLHQVHVRGPAISIARAKKELSFLISNIAQALDKKIVGGVVAAVLSSHYLKVPQAWSKAFAQLCSEDSEIMDGARKAMEAQKAITPVQK